MRLMIAKTEQEFDETAARIAARQILRKPDSVLGFATGNTTIGFHRELSRLTRELGLDWSGIRTVNLDEFLGAAKENPMSVYARMFEQLLNATNIRRENVYLPDSDPEKAAQTCAEFPRILERIGGVDLQVLGIGSNGHIAMNEPGTPWAQDMLTPDIAAQTIADKAHLWGGEERMPKKGISMGIRLILRGRTQLLMAKGKGKAEAVARTLKGEITPEVPASALQLHPDLIVLLDEEAAALL